jgi:hypothetical protein
MFLDWWQHLQTWFRSPSPSTPRQQSRRLGVESLEDRWMPSATPLSYYASAFGVHNIVLQTAGNNIQVFDNGGLVATQAVSSTSAVNIVGGYASLNSLSVLNTSAGVPTNIYLSTSSDQVAVGDGSGVGDIQGPLAIYNLVGVGGSVSVNDSRDSNSRYVVVQNNLISGLAPANISYVGVNSLTLYGGPGRNNFYLSQPTGTMTLFDNGYQDQVTVYTSLSTIYAYGHGGDAIRLYANPGTSNFTGSPTSSQLSGDNYLYQAQGYGQVTAFAGTGQQPGSATLVDGPGSNTLWAGPGAASLQGSNYTLTASGFASVSAYDYLGSDIAYLSTGPSNNTFVASPTTTSLTGDNQISTHGFRQVQVTACPGSTDVAYLYDGAGYNVFVASPTTAYLAGSNYDNQVTGFQQVYAYAYNGTGDSAYMFGSLNSTAYYNSGTYAYIYGPSYFDLAFGFANVVPIFS